MQDLKKQAADAAAETSKKGKKYSNSTQKETMKKLQSSQSYASKQLEVLKKEADAQYKSAQVDRQSIFWKLQDRIMHVYRLDLVLYEAK